MSTPLVSILIPTFNRCDLLRDAIDSALVQDWPNLEVIVSDNGSQDGTFSICQTYARDGRFRYFRQLHNLGATENFKRLVFEYARGDLALILSDDDKLLHRQYVKMAATLFEGDPTTVIVHANVAVHVVGGSTTLGHRRPYASRTTGAAFLASYWHDLDCPIWFCSAVFSVAALRPLKERLDWHWGAEGPMLFGLMTVPDSAVAYVPQVVAQYTVHPGNAIRSGNGAALARHFEDFVRIRELALDAGFSAPTMDRWLAEAFVTIGAPVLRQLSRSRSGLTWVRPISEYLTRYVPLRRLLAVAAPRKPAAFLTFLAPRLAMRLELLVARVDSRRL